MIDETLKLKRSADQAVTTMVMNMRQPDHTTADASEGPDMEIDNDNAASPAGLAVDSLDGADRQRLYELRDAVRTAFKTGLGSRQNAPAEWIGESRVERYRLTGSKTPRSDNAEGSGIRNRGRIRLAPR